MLIVYNVCVYILWEEHKNNIIMIIKTKVILKLIVNSIFNSFKTTMFPEVLYKKFYSQNNK